MFCGRNNLQRHGKLTSCCVTEWQNLSFCSWMSPSSPSRSMCNILQSQKPREEGGGWGVGSLEDPFPSWRSPKTTQSSLICFCSTPESGVSLNMCCKYHPVRKWSLEETTNCLISFTRARKHSGETGNCWKWLKSPLIRRRILKLIITSQPFQPCAVCL